MSEQIQRPTCAVKGLLYGGRAMCGLVINAEFCGNSDPCEHKVDRNALEEKKATFESEPPKLVEALERLVLAVQCRDNSTGDQIRLVETRAELSAAAKNAEEALSAYRQQGGSK